MTDRITDDPRPVPPDRPPAEPNEDAPPRRPPVSVWTARNVAQMVFTALGLGVFLLIGAGALFGTSGRLPVFLMAVGFIGGGVAGFLSALHTVHRRIGLGVRSSGRELPRGAPTQPRRPAPPSTRFVAGRESIQQMPTLLPPPHVSRLVGHHGRVHAVAITPDGRLALTAGKDRGVILWDVQTGFELLAFQGFLAEVRGVAFSPDGRLAAAAGVDTWPSRSGSASGAVRIWDTSTGQELRRFEMESQLWGLAFLPDGLHVAVAGQEVLRLWEIDGPSPVAMVSLNQGVLAVEEIRAVAVSPDGMLAVAGCHYSHDAWLINLDRGESLRALTGHGSRFVVFRRGAVVSVAFSPDGLRVLTGSWDQTARVWNIAGKELTRFEGHRGWWGWRGVVGVAWLDGRRVASVSENGLLCVWDADSGEEEARYHHGAGVTALATTPDGKLALTAGRDGVVRVWEL